jgi:hypothetical protein
VYEFYLGENFEKNQDSEENKQQEEMYSQMEDDILRVELWMNENLKIMKIINFLIKDKDKTTLLEQFQFQDILLDLLPLYVTFAINFSLYNSKNALRDNSYKDENDFLSNLFKVIE